MAFEDNKTGKVDVAAVQRATHDLLVAIGEDPHREGIAETPMRVAKFWKEFIDYDPGKTATAFQSEQVDQMIVVSGMRVWSLCEHHLLPFWCDMSVAYICKDKVLGLSKFARIAKKHGHKIGLQERLVNDIAKELAEVTGSADVAVAASGEHLCMTMRGIQTPHRMKSSCLMGRFRDGPVRAEFFSLSGL